MDININGVKVSIPKGIEKWIGQSEQNNREFNIMLNSIISYTASFCEKKYKNPYTKIYEKQIEDYMKMGVSKEEADRCISVMIDMTEKEISELQK